MFTTRFAASTTDLPRRDKRSETNSNPISSSNSNSSKRRSQISLSLSLFPSPPPREPGTEREKLQAPVRDRPRGHHKNSNNSHRHSVRTSIHTSPPIVSDRESSLYPHRVYASPLHDWSRSCNDLGVASSLAAASTLDFHPFGIIGNNNAVSTGTESFRGYNDQTQSVACLGVYNDTYTPPRHQYHSSIALPTTQHSSRTPLYTPQRGHRDRLFQSTLDFNSASNAYGNWTGTDLEHSQRTSFTDHSYYLEPLNDVDTDQHELPARLSNSPPRRKKWYKPFGKLKELKVIKKVSHHCY